MTMHPLQRTLIIMLALAAALLVSGAEAQTLPDPTQPDLPSARAQVSPAQAPAVQPVPQLSSILVSPTRRLAVIDGALMAEGDRGAHFIVRRIRSEGVDIVLSANGQAMQLSLEQAQLTPSNNKVR